MLITSFKRNNTKLSQDGNLSNPCAYYTGYTSIHILFILFLLMRILYIDTMENQQFNAHNILAFDDTVIGVGKS